MSMASEECTKLGSAWRRRSKWLDPETLRGALEFPGMTGPACLREVRYCRLTAPVLDVAGATGCHIGLNS
jgi:hypothetical protein